MGTIEFDTGFANVLVAYRAICFRPFVNEVLDAAVSHVTELGFFAEVGPLEVFVSRLVRVDRRMSAQEIFDSPVRSRGLASMWIFFFLPLFCRRSAGQANKTTCSFDRFGVLSNFDFDVLL